jgi:hypothetical protein
MNVIACAQRVNMLWQIQNGRKMGPVVLRMEGGIGMKMLLSFKK